MCYYMVFRMTGIKTDQQGITRFQSLLTFKYIHSNISPNTLMDFVSNYCADELTPTDQAMICKYLKIIIIITMEGELEQC